MKIPIISRLMQIKEEQLRNEKKMLKALMYILAEVRFHNTTKKEVKKQ